MTNKSKLLLISSIFLITNSISLELLSWTEKEAFIFWTQFEVAQSNWSSGNHEQSLVDFKIISDASKNLRPSSLSDKKMLQYVNLRIAQNSKSIIEKNKYFEIAFNIKDKLLCEENLFPKSLISDFNNYINLKKKQSYNISNLIESSFKKNHKSSLVNSLENNQDKNINNFRDTKFSNLFKNNELKKTKRKKSRLKIIGIGLVGLAGGFLVNSLISKNQENKARKQKTPNTNLSLDSNKNLKSKLSNSVATKINNETPLVKSDNNKLPLQSESKKLSPKKNLDKSKLILYY